MTEHISRPEEAPNTAVNVVNFVMGRGPEWEELSTAQNQWGYDYRRYGELIGGEDAPQRMLQIAGGIQRELAGERGLDPAFQLASIRTCFELSQMAANISRGHHFYPASGLNGETIGAVQDALGDVVSSIHSTSALVDMVKQNATSVFDLYKEYPDLAVDDSWVDYEVYVLGHVIRLKQTVYLNGFEWGEGSTESHPSLMAKNLIGFRDVSGHIAVVAPIADADLGRIPYTQKEYSKLDRDVRDYLSGTDYDLVLDNARRAITISSTLSQESFVDAENQDALGLFRELHTPQVRGVIEHRLGVSLQEIPLEKQFDFLRFASTCTPEVFERACKALHAIPQEQRPLVFDAFMSTKFGSDYSESILTIAEKYPTEQAVDIFETVGKFNDNARAIAQWYESYDPELAQSIELAMRERLSDALVALEELGTEGHLDIDVSPGRNSENYVSDGRFEMHLQSPGEGIEIVKALGKSLKLIQEVVTAEDVQAHQVNADATHFLMYRFSSEQHGDALLYIRPEGAKGHDAHLEYGNRSGVEASISFIVNPSDPQHLDIYKDPQGVSIRFDREGRRTDESPFSDERDPTRADGSMSVDISSLMGDGRHMPVKIGRFIAAGNLLRAAKTGGHESLHHNNNYFDQDRYGTAEGFAKLGIYTAHMAAATIELQRSGSHASPYPSIPAARR